MSWTLALSASSRGLAHVDSSGNDDTLEEQRSVADEPSTTQTIVEAQPDITHSSPAHLMISVGASLSAPKARMILEFDNFDVRPFGWREDGLLDPPQDDVRDGGGRSTPDHDDVESIVAKLADTSLDSTTSSLDEDESSEAGDSDEDVESSEDEEEVSYAETSFDSTATYESVLESGEENTTEETPDDDKSSADGEEDHDQLSSPSASINTTTPFDAASHISKDNVTVHPSSFDPTRRAPPSSSPPPTEAPASASYDTVAPQKAHSPPHSRADSHHSVPSASSEPFLRAAERLIYRTLAGPPLPPPTSSSSSSSSASRAPIILTDDDDDDELPLSETSILIRAPRKFKHAAFLPRQTYTKELDGALRDCFHPAPPTPSANGARAPKKGTMWSSKVKTTGLRISCRSQSDPVRNQDEKGRASLSTVEAGHSSVQRDPVDGEDEDEMIWWQWTGKLKGIGDDIFS